MAPDSIATQVDKQILATSLRLGHIDQELFDAWIHYYNVDGLDKYGNRRRGRKPSNAKVLENYRKNFHFTVVVENSAVRDVVMKMPPRIGNMEHNDLFVKTKALMMQEIKRALTKFGSVKYQLKMVAIATKQTPYIDPETNQHKMGEDTIKLHSAGKQHALTSGDDDAAIEEFIGLDSGVIGTNWEQFHANGSGWNFEGITEVYIDAVYFNPLNAGSYIETPQWLAHKKCSINVDNSYKNIVTARPIDNDCFKYSLIAAVDRPDKNPQRLPYYKKKISGC
jgi:hypothetical protein